MTARIIILTGERGVGKTTVCHEAVALARARGYTCGGILTMRRDNGSRDVLDVRSDQARPLTFKDRARPAVTQGRFRFDPETLAWGNDVLARALPCQLLVVDELGPLEIEQGKGWPKAFAALSRNDFRLALVVIRPELVTRAQLQLPGNANTIFTVTLDNRDALPLVLIEVLERESGPSPEA